MIPQVIFKCLGIPGKRSMTVNYKVWTLLVHNHHQLEPKFESIPVECHSSESSSSLWTWGELQGTEIMANLWSNESSVTARLRNKDVQFLMMLSNDKPCSGLNWLCSYSWCSVVRLLGKKYLRGLNSNSRICPATTPRLTTGPCQIKMLEIPILTRFKEFVFPKHWNYKILSSSVCNDLEISALFDCFDLSVDVQLCVTDIDCLNEMLG